MYPELNGTPTIAPAKRTAQAKRICQGCYVQPECLSQWLEFASADPWGVRAEMGIAKRRVLREAVESGYPRKYAAYREFISRLDKQWMGYFVEVKQFLNEHGRLPQVIAPVEESVLAQWLNWQTHAMEFDAEMTRRHRRLLAGLDVLLAAEFHSAAA